MEKIKREVFEAWAKNNNWMQISEPATPNGHQVNYLTPAGEFIIVLYSLDGEMQQVVKPMAAPPQSSLMRRPPFIDPRGGG